MTEIENNSSKSPIPLRINGPKIFGVRPDSPFLFKIAAIGEEPIEFMVENLPNSLKLNFSVQKNSPAAVSVYSVNGKEIMQSRLKTLNVGTNTVTLNLGKDQLSTGPYYAKLNVGGEVSVAKFSVVK